MNLADGRNSTGGVPGPLRAPGGGGETYFTTSQMIMKKRGSTETDQFRKKKERPTLPDRTGNYINTRTTIRGKTRFGYARRGEMGEINFLVQGRGSLES